MCNNLPNATTTTVSNGACYTDQYFSWGGYYGSVQYQCYGAYTTDDDSGDDGLSDLELGAIVGGCVGGVGLIAGAIFAWFYCKPSATPPLASSAV